MSRQAWGHPYPHGNSTFPGHGDFPNLVAGLLGRGYDETGITNIPGQNLMRVWRDVERYAAGQGYASRCHQSATMLRRQP